MSNVNQAFLRAYVKTRAAQGTSNGSQNDPAPASAPSGPAHVQTQATQIRIDPPVGQTSNSTGTPASKLGVWSPLGVERGMKASATNQPAPAVVRNAVQPVPMEATYQVRERRQQPSSANTTATPLPAPRQPASPPVPQSRPTSPTASQPYSAANATPPVPKSPSLETLANAWTKKRAPALQELKPRQPAANTTVRIDIPDFPSTPLPSTPLPSTPLPSTPLPSLSAGTPRREPEASAAPTSFRTDAPKARGATGPHSRPSIESKSAAPTPIAAPAPDTTPAPGFGRTKSPSTPAVQQRSGSAASKPVDRERLQELPLQVTFAPSWEVDTFFWPEVIARLEESNPASFRQIGQQLANANQSGLKVLAITSGERGVGRSTVAMHMARAAATAGLKVALVDTDAFNPSLVDQLRLDIQHGWQDCLFEAVPLEEVAVHSISDRITLFPLTGVVSQQQVHANLHRMSKLIRRISTAFDLVLLDSNRLNLDQRDLIGVSNESVVDAAVVVVDTELSIKEKIDSALSILQAMGLSSIGLIENFRS